MTSGRLIHGVACLAAILVVGVASATAQAASSQDIPDVEVEITLDSARGEDIVTVFADDPVGVAQAIQSSIGFTAPDIGPPNLDDPFYPNHVVIFDEGAERHATRIGDEWVYQFDSSALQRDLKAIGIDRFTLSVCHPAVEVIVVPSPNRDDWCDPFGFSWDLTSDGLPVSLRLEMIPDEGDWSLYLAILGAIYGLYLLIAIAVGGVIRRDLPRSGPGLIAISAVLAIPVALAVGG